MSDSPEKRVALVTGGAKRVGRAIVEKLAVEGFHVAFTFNSSAAEATELATRVNGQAIPVDLSDSVAATRTIREQFQSPRLDVLVNNASLYEPARLAETTPVPSSAAVPPDVPSHRHRRVAVIGAIIAILLGLAFALWWRTAASATGDVTPLRGMPEFDRIVAKAARRVVEFSA